jgi:hypothetical protein
VTAHSQLHTGRPTKLQLQAEPPRPLQLHTGRLIQLSQKQILITVERKDRSFTTNQRLLWSKRYRVSKQRQVKPITELKENRHYKSYNAPTKLGFKDWISIGKVIGKVITKRLQSGSRRVELYWKSHRKSQFKRPPAGYQREWNLLNIWSYPNPLLEKIDYCERELLKAAFVSYPVPCWCDRYWIETYCGFCIKVNWAR